MPQYLLDELNGMADGICAAEGSSCDVNKWRDTLQKVNMLPELIRMTCTSVIYCIDPNAISSRSFFNAG
jgi:Mlc titration factor MtfA (ptsG expression regulator)